MTRDEMSSFVERFSGPPEGAPGEGRELEVGAEPEAPIDPNRTIVDPLTGVRQSTGASRSQGAGINDGLGMSRQGGATPPPPKLRSAIEGYRRRISGTTDPAPAPSPRPTPNGGGSPQ